MRVSRSFVLRKEKNRALSDKTRFLDFLPGSLYTR
jgi:hypothetical protein